MTATSVLIVGFDGIDSSENSNAHDMEEKVRNILRRDGHLDDSITNIIPAEVRCVATGELDPYLRVNVSPDDLEHGKIIAQTLNDELEVTVEVGLVYAVFIAQK
ncbi:MAG: hypothetical protein JWN49_128 [Parcubacteria group bacterium]|nr:hypothetical protein [Parcubacteria group bacterium]